MSALTALYFTVETISTVGYGDFSFAGQSTAVEVFGIILIAGGALLLTTVFALITNVVVSWRIEQSLGLQALEHPDAHRPEADHHHVPLQADQLLATQRLLDPPRHQHVGDEGEYGGQQGGAPGDQQDPEHLDGRGPVSYTHLTLPTILRV